MTPKVYIAAPFQMRDAAIRVMRMLELQGIVVTSRWLKQTDEMSDTYARQDLDDVRDADLLLALNYNGWAKAGTGGRHVEFGYALALGKTLLLVGDRTNIFHHLSCVKVVDDTEDLTKHVKRLVAERSAA